MVSTATGTVAGAVGSVTDAAKGAKEEVVKQLKVKGNFNKILSGVKEGTFELGSKIFGAASTPADWTKRMFTRAGNFAYGSERIETGEDNVQRIVREANGHPKIAAALVIAGTALAAFSWRKHSNAKKAELADLVNDVQAGSAVRNESLRQQAKSEEMERLETYLGSGQNIGHFTNAALAGKESPQVGQQVG